MKQLIEASWELKNLECFARDIHDSTGRVLAIGCSLQNFDWKINCTCDFCVDLPWEANDSISTYWPQSPDSTRGIPPKFASGIKLQMALLRLKGNEGLTLEDVDCLECGALFVNPLRLGEMFMLRLSIWGIWMKKFRLLNEGVSVIALCRRVRLYTRIEA